MKKFNTMDEVKDWFWNGNNTDIPLSETLIHQCQISSKDDPVAMQEYNDKNKRHNFNYQEEIEVAGKRVLIGARWDST